MAIIPIIRHAATHNAAVRRWATSLAWTSPTTTIAVRRCSAAPTCWSADAEGRKYTSSMARAVASAEASGKFRRGPRASAARLSGGCAAPTVRVPGTTRTRRAKRPQALRSAALVPGWVPQYRRRSATLNGVPKPHENPGPRRNLRRPHRQNNPQNSRPRNSSNSKSQCRGPRRRAKRNSREGRRVRNPDNKGRHLPLPHPRHGNCETQNGVRRLVHPGSRAMAPQAGEVSADFWFGWY